MAFERFEVRLAPEERRMLTELAKREHASLSAVVRGMIKRTYYEATRERRMLAAERLAAMEIDDVPDPEALNKTLDDVHDVGHLN